MTEPLEPEDRDGRPDDPLDAHQDQTDGDHRSFQEVSENETPSPEKGVDPSSYMRLINQGREKTRRHLAFSLVGLVAIMAIGILVALITHAIKPGDLASLGTVYSPVVTLAGVAIGFYFGRSGDS